jgi:transcriptional regulator with XRE-family HTH domain
MDTPTVQHIGARIKYWRKRRNGMTQMVLAGLAGVSQSYISQVESGQKGIERRSTLVDIAGALQVSVADLLGQPGDPTDPRRAGAAASVPAIRASLVEIEEGERRTPTRDQRQMDAAMDRLAELRAQADYASMSTLLPALLIDAAAHSGRHLARVGYESATCLKNLGYRDLALPAARVAVAGALDADDPAWIGATRFFHTVALPIEAAATTSRVADRALGDLQAKAADPQVRQMLGQVHLSASLACAVDRRPDDALAHLQAAEEEARSLGGDPDDGIGFNLLGFGPTNIGLWRMTVAGELGEHGRVIELARAINPGPLRMADRHHSYWLNQGLALARSGRTDREALSAFMHAERAAPVPFSLNAAAHDAVMAMWYRVRRRAVPDDLRVIARRLGIEVPE